MASFIDDTFRVAIVNKARVIRGFMVFYGMLVLFLFFGSRSVYLRDDFFPTMYNLGVWCGRIALMAYCTTLLPGMAKRFGIQNKFFSLLRIFRRYIGISVFLLALIHASFVRLILFLPQVLFFQGPLFQIFGFVSLIFLFFMFLTSNDWSQAKLGLWWYRLHWVTHLIMITVLFHVLLQRISIWSVLIGTIVMLQLISFIIFFSRKTQ